MKNPLVYLTAALPIALTLAPVAGAQEAMTRYSYQCANGLEFSAQYGDEQAIVQLDEQTVTLDRIPTASGVAYSNSEITLYTQGTEAIMDVNGQRLYDECLVQSASTPQDTTTDSMTDSTTLGESTTPGDPSPDESITQERRVEPSPESTAPPPASAPAASSTESSSQEPVRALW